jgi:hypothetical protein
MAEDLRLTEDQEPISGRFWLPASEDRKASGVLYLKKGQEALLEVSMFQDEGEDPFRSPALSDPSENSVQTAHRLWFAGAFKVLHGEDDQGRRLTLLNCHSSHSNSTLAKIGHSYSCQTVIFGRSLPPDDLLFDGIDLRFDHQEQWIAQNRLGHHQIIGDKKTDDERYIKIPILKETSIPLDLRGYTKSSFDLLWGVSSKSTEQTFRSWSYLCLHFESPRSLSQTAEVVQSWRKFFSLAMRTTVDLVELHLLRKDHTYIFNEDQLRELPVWISRSHSSDVEDPKSDRNFHYNFSDIHSHFPAIVERWEQLAEPWSAVLHRFFAVTTPRDLYMNESFLFLAQAIEALHRSRTGNQDVPMKQAAKEAYLQSPTELRDYLGPRKAFTDQLHKTRNYWTHHGKPTPDDDPEVLDDIPLILMTDKLRFIVEAAIMKEIGIPDSCISNVWSPRWQGHFVDFK